VEGSWGAQQKFDEAQIAWSQRQLFQLNQGCPLELHVLETSGDALDLNGQEGDQKTRAGVCDFKQRRAGLDDLDGEFLAQFARNRFRIGFSGMTLAAWKFPQAAMALVEGTAARKETAFYANGGRNNPGAWR
jgi:hypothetical protein